MKSYGSYKYVALDRPDYHYILVRYRGITRCLQGLSIVDLPNIARQVNKEVAWDIQYAPEETHTRVGHVPDYARVISLSGPPPVDGKPDPALSLCQSVYT